MVRTALVVVLVALVVLSCAERASAQDVQLPEPVLLQSGARAPFTGQLMAQEDVLTWSRTIEDLERRLVSDIATAAAVCEQRLTGERARTEAAQDVGLLHDTLYQQRLDALAQEVVAARGDARREWWEHPALWFAVGVLVTTGVVVAIAATM